FADWHARSSFLLAELGATRVLADAEYDELGRLHRSDADLTRDDAGVHRFGRVRLGVALDVEGLFGCCAEERAVAPDVEQEAGDRAIDARPQVLVVRLEDDPLRSLEDRLLDEVEQP